jgi:hypothetical protein
MLISENIKRVLLKIENYFFTFLFELYSNSPPGNYATLIFLSYIINFIQCLSIVYKPTSVGIIINNLGWGIYTSEYLKVLYYFRTFRFINSFNILPFLISIIYIHLIYIFTIAAM